MGSISVFVGLDYHDETIRVCVMTAAGEMRFNRDMKNDPRAIAELIGELGTPESVAIEACCGASNFASELQRLTGWTVKQAHPGYVAQLKKSKDKTDFGDARLLADLLRVGYLPEVWLADVNTRQLRRLVRYRQGLVRDRKDVKLRIRSVLRDERIKCDDARPWTQAWIEWIRTVELPELSRWVINCLLKQLDDLIQQVKETEDRFHEAVKDDEVCQKLMTFAGIGLVTTVTLRAEIGHFERFSSGKKLARFCGVTPRNASSGKRQADAGLVCESNEALRAILVQAAKRLPRCDDRWKEFKDRLRASKPANVVTAAIANRWIRWLYHQMVSPVTEVAV